MKVKIIASIITAIVIVYIGAFIVDCTDNPKVTIEEGKSMDVNQLTKTDSVVILYHKLVLTKADRFKKEMEIEAIQATINYRDSVINQLEKNGVAYVIINGFLVKADKEFVKKRIAVSKNADAIEVEGMQHKLSVYDCMIEKLENKIQSHGYHPVKDSSALRSLKADNIHDAYHIEIITDCIEDLNLD